MMSTTPVIGQTSSFYQLPEELHLKICGFLDARSMGQLGVTCWRFKRITNDDALWKFLLFKDFIANKLIATKSYKGNYIFFYFFYLNTPFPYPSEYTLDQNYNWTPFYSLTSVIRILTLKTNGLALINKISLLGYRDGKIALNIFYPKIQFTKLKNYLCSIDTSEEFRHLNDSGELLINNGKLMRKIFTAFITFNSIPHDCLTLMQGIIRLGNWMQVTPL